MTGIIVGVDGSDHSRGALEWAVKEAAIRDVPLTVLTVHQALRGFWGGTVTYPGEESLTEVASKAAVEETDSILDALGPESRPTAVSVHAIHGLPAEEILRAAADAEADMIVVGSRGAGGFTRLLLGSVATQVSHHSTCPVVVIPGDGR